MATISALHFYFLRAERLRQIDQEIETTASALISSDVSRIPLDDFEESEDRLHDVLGTYKMSKIIILKDNAGNVLYENANAQFVTEEIPVKVGWATYQIGKHEVRLLSVLIPSLKQIVQVGVLLDREMLYWRHIDLRFLIYSCAVSIGLLAVSIILSKLLLEPLRQLALFLDHVSGEFGRGSAQIKPFEGAMPAFQGDDEFSKLTESVKRLTDLIKLNVRTFQNWTALMAHEMKTPITIIQNLVEKVQRERSVMEEDVSKEKEVLEELFRLNHLINSFVEWASVENNPDSVSDIHAIRIEKDVRQVVERIQSVNKDRIVFVDKSELVVFANPLHVEQLVTNLISNALKYSSSSEKVTVKIEGNKFTVEDKGQGIPSPVLEKLGQPFNFQRQVGVSGSGLGLAWVNTVCKKYGWELRFLRQSGLTRVEVSFSESPSSKRSHEK